MVAGSLAVRMHRQVLLVVAHGDEADDCLDDLQWFEASGHALSCYRLPALEVLPGETIVSLELLGERLGAVQRLADFQQEDRSSDLGAVVWVASIQGLMQAVPKPQALSKLLLPIHCGQAMALGQVLTWLTQTGYERVEAIEQPGHFASRGGIVDIYLPAGAIGGEDDAAVRDCGGGPIRLDFFGL